MKNLNISINGSTVRSINYQLKEDSTLTMEQINNALKNPERGAVIFETKDGFALIGVDIIRSSLIEIK